MTEKIVLTPEEAQQLESLGHAMPANAVVLDPAKQGEEEEKSENMHDWTLVCGHTVYWYLDPSESPPPQTLWCRQCRARIKTA